MKHGAKSIVSAMVSAVLLFAMTPGLQAGTTAGVTFETAKEAAVQAPSGGPAKPPAGGNGLDARGRMVAEYGSPVIDGRIDPVWDKAKPVKAQHVSGQTSVSATFRALWDDRAIYILAEVKDNDLSVQSGTPYMQDSVEIFLDENNDKTKEYGADDVHVRVNFENVQTVDKGNAARFYTATSKTKDGYIVEARLALKKQPQNESVLGIELQVNDARGAVRVGTLNVFDATGTAWDDTGKFGEIVLKGKKKHDTPGLNPYDLLNLIKQALSLDFSLYRNADVVKDAIVQITAENLLGGGKVTQKQIDEQYAALSEAIAKLELTEEAANEKYFKPLPEEYLMESDKPGTIETLTYTTPNLNQGLDTKKLHVYLPYGYDAADKTRKYNVLYLMHGGGENEDLIFGGPGQSKSLKRILDNMVARGDIEPLIVVTPTFYGGKNDVALFHEELIETIVPLVETRYNTYAASASKEDLKASRAHRAFGGFSMGSVTTWHVFVKALDYFKYFMPLSGDSWALGERGGGGDPAKTAEFLAQTVRNSGYGPQDFYIFSATGKQDIAYPNMKPQIDAMRQWSDVFRYSADPAKGNFYFMVAENGTHTWYWQNQYIYNILPDLFRGEK